MLLRICDLYLVLRLRVCFRDFFYFFFNEVMTLPNASICQSRYSSILKWLMSSSWTLASVKEPQVSTTCSSRKLLTNRSDRLAACRNRQTLGDRWLPICGKPSTASAVCFKMTWPQRAEQRDEVHWLNKAKSTERMCHCSKGGTSICTATVRGLIHTYPVTDIDIFSSN